MRRSEALVVSLLCPHFERPVRAVRNTANDRMVDCESKHECVEAGAYPQACPVFRGHTPSPKPPESQGS